MRSDVLTTSLTGFENLGSCVAQAVSCHNLAILQKHCVVTVPVREDICILSAASCEILRELAAFVCLIPLAVLQQIVGALFCRHVKLQKQEARQEESRNDCGRIGAKFGVGFRTCCDSSCSASSFYTCRIQFRCSRCQRCRLWQSCSGAGCS